MSDPYVDVGTRAAFPGSFDGRAAIVTPVDQLTTRPRRTTEGSPFTDADDSYAQTFGHVAHPLVDGTVGNDGDIEIAFAVAQDQTVSFAWDLGGWTVLGDWSQPPGFFNGLTVEVAWRIRQPSDPASTGVVITVGGSGEFAALQVFTASLLSYVPGSVAAASSASGVPDAPAQSLSFGQIALAMWVGNFPFVHDAADDIQVSAPSSLAHSSSGAPGLFAGALVMAAGWFDDNGPYVPSVSGTPSEFMSIAVSLVLGT